MFRIAGGSKADLGQFPYQAQMQFLRGTPICGGSILTEKFILTAAHCRHFMDEILMPPSVKILVGSVQHTNGTQYEVDEFISHEEYDKKTFRNDLMLIKVENTILFNDNVKPIKIHPHRVTAGQTVVASGWGFTNSRYNVPDTLQFIIKSTISFRECRGLLPEQDRAVLFKETLCTKAEENRGVCPGDSGGPLVLNGELVGVVSWGYVCGYNIPNMYVRVADYLPWINDKIGVKSMI